MAQPTQRKRIYKCSIAQIGEKMEEKTMNEKTEWKFVKETDVFSDSANNYVIPHELTVTITLKEYRDLVKQAADAKIAEANSKWVNEYNENQKLKKEIETLHNALASLREKKEKKENEYDV
jgi:hypothetical protein